METIKTSQWLIDNLPHRKDLIEKALANEKHNEELLKQWLKNHKTISLSLGKK